MQSWKRYLGALLLVLGTASGPGNAADALAREDAATTLDFNEQTHLVFICEEEKLARDVYHLFSRRFPELGVFAELEAAKESGRCTVEELLRRYRVSIPRVNDNVGVFSWGIYGRHFTEKFLVLSNQGSLNPLSALYAGAFIEELNIIDINQCPKVIVDVDNGINDASACGMKYTDNPAIRAAYDELLAESRRHLQILVNNIEQRTGPGSYRAQLLQPEDLASIVAP